VSPEEMMNGPCQMHFYLDNNGKRQSGHLQKDCRNFQALQQDRALVTPCCVTTGPKQCY
jgi:hypothetical protein